MPVTPVAGIPYPLGTAPPVIPTDMSALATQTDSWVSGLDTALSSRLSAVSSRVTAVSARVANSATNLATSNTTMSTADTAIATANSALSAVETRLSSQDATAASLQSRYTADTTAITQLQWDTPRGVLFNSGSTSGVSISGSGLYTIQEEFIPYDGTLASMRVFYTVSLNITNVPSLYFDMRICWGVGTATPSWGNCVAEIIRSGISGNPNGAVHAISGIVANTTSGVTVGLMVQSNGNGGGVSVLTSHIQHLTGNV